MENYRDVELTIGTVRVYSPPLGKIDAIIAKDPNLKLPEPEVETLVLPSGKEVVSVKDDDPGYLREKKRVEELRDAKGRELMWLYALRKVEPPDDWDIESDMGDVIRYTDPEWSPRSDSAVGRKLDYIEWVVLVDGANVKAVNKVLNELAGISEEVAKQVEDSFPNTVEEETA